MLGLISQPEHLISSKSSFFHYCPSHLTMVAQHSGGSSNSRHLKGAQLDVVCKHKIPSKLRIVKTAGENQGRKFYGCALWPAKVCKSFRWECKEFDCPKCSDLQLRLLEQYTSIAELELQFKSVEEKLHKLKLKKEKLAKEVVVMKNELARSTREAVKSARGEKFALFGLFISWVLFAVVLVFIK